MSQQDEVRVIEQLMGLAARYGLEELEVQEGDLKVTLRAVEYGPPDDEATPPGRYTLWTPPVWGEQAAQESAPERPETAVPLRAPLTGHFYRAATPDAPPFAEVGQQVEEGEVVGLIEAMKVFSDVPAEQAGTILEIVVENGRLVQRGDILMYIDTAA
ncbi:MAG: acetyl-CoA carboxylase [Armatimonadota bacterium]